MFCLLLTGCESGTPLCLLPLGLEMPSSRTGDSPGESARSLEGMTQHGWFFLLPGKPWDRWKGEVTGVKSRTLTLLPFSFPSLTSESYMQRALSTVLYLFYCMQVMKDSTLETILNRLERSGGR
ncbi:unnamed protein product [Pipistrellus nathusii]|uniref:Uncharacterized protein n=1 Tax=Pipistrellus nathusii TaxID=59473 RepID=A0ABN9ZVM1_PIPNA